MHFAAARGDKKVMDYLIEKGGILECEDEEGNTPFFTAVVHSNKAITMYMIE